MRILTVVGIRPDFIRMSQIIRLLDEGGGEHVLAHAGQHYSFNMDRVFFEELGIREPDHNMGVGSGTHAEQTAKLLIETEKLIFDAKPHLCVFLGDSNTSLAAIAAAKCNIKVAHIEAGMRSFDWRMPEEKNRTIVDHISDYLYAYTQRYRENLLLEGIASHKIKVIGNPIVDVVNVYLPLARERSDILEKMGLVKGEYVLVTAHRAENVDSRDRLTKILKGLELVGEKLKVPVVFPMYYRTQRRVRQMGLQVPKNVMVLDPLGFLDFLYLEADALCLISDSGTVQEEGCILRVPCVTIRLSTERPETVEVGANILSGVEPEQILECTLQMVKASRNWENPLGDGTASSRIVEDILGRQTEITDGTFEVPFLDGRKRACFSPFVDLNTRIDMVPVWSLEDFVEDP
ncbi:MAG: non-hydrolyzing UDP-N-acetylglucosamine 2-epimerase [Dehalococcoidia bacterium]